MVMEVYVVMIEKPQKWVCDGTQLWELYNWQWECLVHFIPNKLDEYGDVLKNKAWLVANRYRQEEGIDFEESFAPIARPSRNRCRSPATSVPLVTPVLVYLSLVHADLLPPCKRIRGVVVEFYYDDSTKGSFEAYTEPDINFGVQADINADIAAGETTTSLKVSIVIRTDVGVEVGIGSEREDEEAESRDRNTIEIGVDRISDIESAQREQGRMMLVASEQRA
nr:retrovirus-related Pol polyprotein from transposon TNT 1-94 [Tanacetum cinerariifolium]